MGCQNQKSRQFFPLAMPSSGLQIHLICSLATCPEYGVHYNVPFSTEGARLLFQVLSERHEHASTLITTNLNFSEWTEVFGDENLTAALLDRITHRCHIQPFDWGSVRYAESLSMRPQI